MMVEINSLASELDKSVATLVVSSSYATRRFIGELLLSAAAAYLLKRYVDKYLDELGYFDDIAKRHGERTRTFLEKMRGGTIDRSDIEVISQDLEEEFSLAHDQSPSEHAMQLARAEVVALLIEAGAVRAQAEYEAAKVVKYANTAILAPKS